MGDNAYKKNPFKSNVEDARSVSIYPYNGSHILQYETCKYFNLKWINVAQRNCKNSVNNAFWTTNLKHNDNKYKNT